MQLNAPTDFALAAAIGDMLVGAEGAASAGGLTGDSANDELLREFMADLEEEEEEAIARCGGGGSKANPTPAEPVETTLSKMRCPFFHASIFSERGLAMPIDARFAPQLCAARLAALPT